MQRRITSALTLRGEREPSLGEIPTDGRYQQLPLAAVQSLPGASPALLATATFTTLRHHVPYLPLPPAIVEKLPVCHQGTPARVMVHFPGFRSL
jgi:hypothetical protein